MKRKLHYEQEIPYIVVNNRAWYMNEVDRETGMNLTLFTNCGYYGEYRITGFEYGVNDYAILERVEP